MPKLTIFVRLPHDMRRFITIFLAILAIAPARAIDTSVYRFHQMPETSYYGGVHSIAKDSIGRIWFSGFDAVYMFNGDSFRRINKEIFRFNPETHWAMGHVVTDIHGDVYVATDHGLFRFDYATEGFKLVIDGNIGNVVAGKDGLIWLIRDNKIVAFSPESLQEMSTFPLPEGVETSIPTLSLTCDGPFTYVGNAGVLYRLDASTGNYARFVRFPSDGTVVRDVMDVGGHIFVLTQMEGIFQYSADGLLEKKYPLPESASSKQLYLDKNGIIWVATQYGLLLLDPSTGETSMLRSDVGSDESLPNNSVWSIFEDPDGWGVWVGTYGGKLALTTISAEAAGKFYRASRDGLSNPIVSCFAEASDGTLWVGTEGGGLNRVSRDGKFSYFTQNNDSGIASNMIKKIAWGRDSSLLVSEFNGGINVLRRGSTHFGTLPGTEGISVYDFLAEGDRGYWLADPDASLRFLDTGTGTVGDINILSHDGISLKMQVETMFHDQRGNLWLLTHTGVYSIDVHTHKVLRQYVLEDKPYSSNNICSYVRTQDGEIWFGTRGGGINVLRNNGSYASLRDSSGNALEGKMIFSMLEDVPTKDVWLATNEGVWVFDRSRCLFFKPDLGLSSGNGSYYVRSCFKRSSGQMLFGGTDGFTAIFPDRVGVSAATPKIYFTDFLIDDKDVSPEMEDSPISRSISTMNGSQTIRLSHRQSNIEVRFSSDSYLNPVGNRYAYRMSGLSDKWTELPPGQRAVQFFNLRAGSYQLQVVAATAGGKWGAPATLSFHVRPAFYRSAWALLLYALALVFLAYMLWRYLTNKKIYEERLELERKKEENLSELSKARINFFTNISHDLKTPLTMILDPLRQLKERIPATDEVRKDVDLIERNASRISHMVSQLLQFREIESQKITMNPQPGDIQGFVKNLFSLFEPFAAKRGVETDFDSKFTKVYTNFDQDIIEKIFSNLFSNAFKYTPSGGHIGVSVTEGEKPGFLRFTVSNSGAEISEETKTNIFEAFSRGGMKPEVGSSSGLGLAIVKQLVDVIGGTIEMKSENFIVSFILDIPSPEVRADKSESDEDSAYEYAASEVDELVSETGRDDSDKPTLERKRWSIVLIEDDRDFRNYLSDRLSEDYNVYAESNGRDGIARAEKMVPDIIITDLIMPEADGLEVCRELRANIKTSHIPIVMLSGLGNSGDNRTKALEAGANVFLDKPVDLSYLKQQIKAFLKSREDMKNLYSKRYIAEPSKLVISSVDDKLLQKAMDCIERNMDNSDYDVDSFIRDMAMGRTLLYEKINRLTGMSIKEFIMDMRLKRAAQLMKDSDLNVSEISFKTGFANPKYFSICFKRHFGLTPTEFKKSSSED